MNINFKSLEWHLLSVAIRLLTLEEYKDFFIIALLGYNLHTKYFTHLKCTIQWLLVFPQLRNQ